MSKTEELHVNIDFVRSLVKQYSELGQWTSALFWADAAAAAAGSAADQASGDDIWLLASAMLARGELHRAAYAVTSRGLHKQHLLCLGVAMRAYLQAKEPALALNLMDEADSMLLEPRPTDQTHNRALAGVLVWQARALIDLERREAAAKALSSALRADCACYEALDLLLEQHALTPREERELVESLDLEGQLSRAEALILGGAYRERLQRYCPLPRDAASPDTASMCESEAVGARMNSAAATRSRRLAASCRWREALAVLDSVDPWCCVEVRVACLVELKKSSELFAFAHRLVDAYPTAWTSWFAVGCYYYLIGKRDFARRYLCKAKSLEPSAGCIWLTYGHSFAADREHDQAMAAYFKASQLMAGCHLPPLYVAVECSLLNNMAVCERFLMRAALAHNGQCGSNSICEEIGEDTSGDVLERIAHVTTSAHVAHEAGAAAHAQGRTADAHALWLVALHCAADHTAGDLDPCWAATLDALGHAARALGRPREALEWHERALALRPGRASTYAAMGLCLALLGKETEAAGVLHTALSKDPDDIASLTLLDAIVDRLDATLSDEEIPQFPFPALNLSLPPETPLAPSADDTNVSDMSMSFD